MPPASSCIICFENSDFTQSEMQNLGQIAVDKSPFVHDVIFWDFRF